MAGDLRTPDRADFDPDVYNVNHVTYIGDYGVNRLIALLIIVDGTVPDLGCQGYQSGSCCVAAREQVVRGSERTVAMGGLGDKLEGKAEEVKGDVKEKVGDATDNRSMQAEGVGDQASGEAKQAIGEAKDALRDVDDDRRV